MLEGNGALDIWTHGLKMGFGFEWGAIPPLSICL